jgi:hypothetical protein
MKRRRAAAAAWVLSIILGCSSSAEHEPLDAPTAGSGSGGGSAAGATSSGGATSAAGTTSQLGGGGAATTSSSGSAGAGQAGGFGGTVMGGAGGSTHQNGAGVGGGPPAGQPFACSEVMGLTLTRQWYEAGFEKGVVDAGWQLKAAQSAYVDEWAKADSPFWATPLISPCQTSSSAPDHVVFAVLSWTIMAQADWETAIRGAVTNIQSKYAGVRRIDLMTIIRGPANAACGDPNVYAENTHIPAALDAALAAVAAGSPTLVHVAPQFAVDACSDFEGTGPHLTDAGNTKLAAKIAASFAAIIP